MNEIWKDIPGYEERYQVSDLGRVKSVICKGKPRDRIVRQSTNKAGYKRVGLLYRPGVRFHFYVHALVLSAFVGLRPSPTHQACHGDEGPGVNRLTNLRWGTVADNTIDRHAAGTTKKGSLNPGAKLNEQKVRAIKRALRTGVRKVDLARKHGVTPTTIGYIASGKKWSHVA